MFHVLVLTHGRLGEVLLESARTIAGTTPGVSALTLDWSDTFDEAHRKVRAALEEVDGGEGVLILTDMYGGTPFNVARKLAQSGRIEIVTGVNLPMVLRLSCLDGDPPPLERAAQWILGKGQAAICLCTEAPEAVGDAGCD